jgi:hypothetical protein
MTPGGIVGNDGTKNTFVLDANTGNAVFSGTITGQSSIAAGAIDINKLSGSNFEYSTPINNQVVFTFPYVGSIRYTIVGGGGGGAGGGGGGSGGGDATDYSGLAGSAGYSSISVLRQNIPIGSTVSLTVGAGGAGGNSGGTSYTTGASGTGTLITIRNSAGTVLYSDYAAGGAGGVPYRYNDNPDAGSDYTKGVAPRTTKHSFRFPDAGDGAGGMSGQNGLASDGITGSSGGVGGFYGKEAMVYWGALTTGRQNELNGSAGSRGGGGGGGIATCFRGFSRGSLLGYRSAVYTYNGTNTPSSSGGKGGDGYAFFEVFNPTSIVLRSEWDTLNATLASINNKINDNGTGNIGCYCFAIYNSGNPGTVTYVNVGDLVSGSTLKPGGIGGTYNGPYEMYNSFFATATNSLTGTWRCLGYAGSYYNNNPYLLTLWKRIA